MISIIALIDNGDNTNNYTDKSFDDSITSIINQKHQDWELKIVLYNVSHSDNQTIQNYKEIDSRIDIIKYYDSDINTPLKAIIKASTNECKYNYIAILNINDIWAPNKLELQSSIILKFNRIDVIGSKSCCQNAISCIPEGELYNYNIFKINPFINSTVVIKKSILKYLETSISTSISTYTSINTNIEFILNALWIQCAIHHCVLYNISDITVKHIDSKILTHYKECYETAEFKKIVDDFKSKYIRIKFFSDYCSSGHCKQEYERQCLVQNIDYYGKTKKIYFTTTETYTHTIILNCPTPENLQVEAKNVIGFAQEPHDTPFLKIYHNNFIEYAVKNIGKYFIGSDYKFPTPTFVGHHGFLFYETPKPMPFRPEKSKLMSIMVSNKTYTPGHRYRHMIVRHILKYKWPIDIWGNGVDIYKREFPDSKYIKGGFKTMEEMCKDYMFTIAIENTSHEHYFTEKIINPFINNTIPLYWGCKKIEEYFPKHTIPITGNITRDIVIINTVLRNPNKYIAEYKINQEMVLNKVNLVKNIERIFDV
uniref:Fucosyltransferase C-terminal domain-containing protein n=1 Tax=viral metagenome TaxID=1070528 RepID=A0A6C0EXQ2_9ZZZZ